MRPWWHYGTLNVNTQAVKAGSHSAVFLHGITLQKLTSAHVESPRHMRLQWSAARRPVQGVDWYATFKGVMFRGLKHNVKKMLKTVLCEWDLILPQRVFLFFTLNTSATRQVSPSFYRVSCHWTFYSYSQFEISVCNKSTEARNPQVLCSQQTVKSLVH